MIVQVSKNLTNQIPDWGDGSAAKYQGLVDATQLLEAFGAKTPPTRTLPMSVTKIIIAFIRSHTSAEGPDVQLRFPNGLGDSLPGELKELIRSEVRPFKNEPLVAIRSDAHGDNTGIGVYESYLINPADEQSLFDAVLRVIASHDTPEAKYFREEFGLPDGIAVMIQPVIGSRIEAKLAGSDTSSSCFAPAYSLTLEIGAKVPGLAVPGLGNPMDVKLCFDQRQFDGFRFSSTARERATECHGLVVPLSDHSAQPVRALLPDTANGALNRATPTIKQLNECLNPLPVSPSREARNLPRKQRHIEACVGWDGEVTVVQYGEYEISRIAFHDVDGGFRVAQSAVGAAYLHDGWVLICDSRSQFHSPQLPAFLEQCGVKGRSVALLMNSSDLRYLSGEPKALWGSLRNIKVILCGEDRHESAVENHLTGAIRKIGGFCVVRDIGNLTKHADAIRSADGQFTLIPKCCDARIEEGVGAVVKIKDHHH